jgi:hypothetical protein
MLRRKGQNPITYFRSVVRSMPSIMKYQDSLYQLQSDAGLLHCNRVITVVRLKRHLSFCRCSNAKAVRTNEIKINFIQTGTPENPIFNLARAPSIVSVCHWDFHSVSPRFASLKARRHSAGSSARTSSGTFAKPLTPVS